MDKVEKVIKNYFPNLHSKTLAIAVTGVSLVVYVLKETGLC
jgi:hypothetical protein